MMRRNINVGGKSIARTIADFHDVKDAFRAKFGVDADQAKDFVQWLYASGWDGASVDSARKQFENKNRPALDVELIGHAPVIEHLMRTQRTYTSGVDTADDPNYAVRHPGQTELILRRVTAGDLLMMQAAHTLSLKSGGDDQEKYWENLWGCMLDILLPSDDECYGTLYNDPFAAATFAYSFALNRMREDYSLLKHTFMRKQSAYYTGVVTRLESRRATNSDGSVTYGAVWAITHIDGETLSTLYRAAVTVLPYAIDTSIGNLRDGGFHLKQGATVYSSFLYFLSVMRDLPSLVRYVDERTNK